MNFEKAPFLVDTDFSPNPKDPLAFLADFTGAIPIIINTHDFWIHMEPGCVYKIIIDGREVQVDKAALLELLRKNIHDQMILILVTGKLDPITTSRDGFFINSYDRIFPGKKTISTNWWFDVKATELVLVPVDKWKDEWELYKEWGQSKESLENNNIPKVGLFRKILKWIGK